MGQRSLMWFFIAVVTLPAGANVSTESLRPTAPMGGDEARVSGHGACNPPGGWVAKSMRTKEVSLLAMLRALAYDYSFLRWTWF